MSRDLEPFWDVLGDTTKLSCEVKPGELTTEEFLKAQQLFLVCRKCGGFCQEFAAKSRPVIIEEMVFMACIANVELDKFMSGSMFILACLQPLVTGCS